MTHYEILGIRKTATSDEIKDAYKKLVKKYHPDVYIGDKTFAEKKIKEINEAYDVLSNPDKKSDYDDLINPNTTTTYTPPDYTSYQYNSSYSQTKKSKRNAEAQGSKYSYENYKKTYYNQNAYDYQKRYTNYHRSKTPNSNYSGNSPEQPSINKDAVTNLSKASVLFIIGFILIIYIILLVSNIKAISGNFGTETDTYSSEPATTTDEYYTDTQTQQTYEDYSTSNNETKENFFSREEFDINTIYSDTELIEVYNSYFKDVYPTFEEFKQDMADYYYYTYYQEDSFNF